LNYRRKKYYFDPSTLTFNEVKRSGKTRFSRFLIYFFLLNCSALIFFFLFYLFIEPPEVMFEKYQEKKYSDRYSELIQRVDSLTGNLKSVHQGNDQIYRNILEMDSIPINVRSAGSGGYNPTTSSDYSTHFFNTLFKKIESLKRQVTIQEKSYDEILITALEKNNELKHFPGIPPLKLTSNVSISSYFGTREDPFTLFSKSHHGVDFCGPENTEIYTTADGVVTLAKLSRKGYGNEVVVDHGFGHCTRYAHLNEILVQEGQIVERGQIIGKMGSTGRSTGTHLHYEVWFYKEPVNPLYFFADDLTPEEFEQLAKKD